MKTIFSVIASPSRLEVLKILNTKGPMTYSELKTLAGFKAKKESGKFAYHLRKLLRQNLIVQNRAERKYMLTTLGRLVLNSAKQIEEQALLESGRLFVRSSKHKLEEFTTDRIVHSLVTEAGMPVELAQRVASEAESRIYKFQTAYLTAPLIRELVNSILIEEGLEEYRHKLSRLGMPVYDVTEEFEKIGQSSYGIEALVNQTAESVLSEYLLLIQLPRDITDSHLSGDIHISNVGNWNLRPDILFVNISSEWNNPRPLEGKLLFVPRSMQPSSDFLTKITGINFLLSREANKEVYYMGLSKIVSDKLSKQSFLELFTHVTYSSLQGSNKPQITFEIDVKDAGLILDELLLGYLEHVSSVPFPAVGLTLVNADRLQEEYLAVLLKILKNNGIISLKKGDDVKRSLYGVSVKMNDGAGPIVLDSISINMPRIALDTQNDEVYFRARTRIQLQNAMNALLARRRLIESNFKLGLLPSLATLENLVYKDPPLLRINLTGLDEALTLVNPSASFDEISKMMLDTIDSTDEYFASATDERSDNFALSLTNDESASRFLQLDRDKFGRSKVKSFLTDKYSQGIGLFYGDLNDRGKVERANLLLKAVKGGVNVKLFLKMDENDGLAQRYMQKAITSLDYFCVIPMVRVCVRCGRKDQRDVQRCSVCNGIMISSY